MFYLISIYSINLFKIIKETKLELDVYLKQIFSNLLSTTIINIVLNIGVFAVLGIIVALLIPDFDFDLFLRAEIAILGFYTVPAYIYAFMNKDSKVTDLAHNLLKYVIVPLTYIALVVIYLYIFKIFITGNMPSNSVFEIILSLFIISIPIFVLYKSLNLKNKFFNAIANNITYVFIPLYLLQAYAIIIRVSIYGLTKDRYLGLAILVVEAIILFLMKFKERKYLVYSLYVFVLASFITLIAPVINYEDASIRYHVNVIENLLKDKKFDDLNAEELEKLIASYEYLKDERALDKLSVKLDEHEVNIIEPYNNNRAYFYENFSPSSKTIDISKYSKMRQTYQNGHISDSEIIELEGFEIDLRDIFNKLIQHENIEEIIIPLDQNNDLYVIHINIDGENGKVNYYNIEGYILTK